MHKDLGSIPGTVWTGLVACVCNVGPWEVEAVGLEVQDHSSLHSEASLDFVRLISTCFFFFFFLLVKRSHRRKKSHTVLCDLSLPARPLAAAGPSGRCCGCLCSSSQQSLQICICKQSPESAPFKGKRNDYTLRFLCPVVRLDLLLVRLGRREKQFLWFAVFHFWLWK